MPLSNKVSMTSTQFRRCRFGEKRRKKARLLGYGSRLLALRYVSGVANVSLIAGEMAPKLTGHGLPLSKCEAYKRVYDQLSESH
jgi:hypothetical protein